MVHTCEQERKEEKKTHTHTYTAQSGTFDDISSTWLTLEQCNITEAFTW